MKLPPTNGFLLSALGAMALGCSTSASQAAVDSGAPSIDSASDVAAGDAATDSSSVDAGLPQTFVRLANMSPDAPAMDFCFAPHGMTLFQGPFVAELGGDVGAGVDAGVRGISYAEVSAYVALAPGQYDLRLVPAGSTSCAVSVAIDAGVFDGGATDGGTIDGGSMDAGVLDGGSSIPATTNLPMMSANASTTILIAGELVPAAGTMSLRIVAMPDDTSLAGGGAALRAVNALPSGVTQDFGFGAFAGGWQPVLASVAFAAASAQAAPNQGMVDPNGYLPIAALDGQTLSARASTGATGDTVVAQNVSVVAGSVATLIAVGGAAGDSAHPAALVLCIDNNTPFGAFADCSVLP